MDTLHSIEAVRRLRDLRDMLRSGYVSVVAYEQNTQEVESCYGADTGSGSLRYVPRVRLIFELRRPDAKSLAVTPVLNALETVEMLSQQGSLRNLHVTLEPCEERGDHGIRVSLWYNVERVLNLAMCG